GFSGAWLSPVERLLWEQDVGGSNPLAPISMRPLRPMRPGPRAPRREAYRRARVRLGAPRSGGERRGVLIRRAGGRFPPGALLRPGSGTRDRPKAASRSMVGVAQWWSTRLWLWGLWVRVPSSTPSSALR